MNKLFLEFLWDVRTRLILTTDDGYFSGGIHVPNFNAHKSIYFISKRVEQGNWNEHDLFTFEEYPYNL